MKGFFATILLAGLASAATIPVPQLCSSIPSNDDPAVNSAIYKIALGKKVTDRKLSRRFILLSQHIHRHDLAGVMLSMFETAWVESHVNNLHCGTGDSVGQLPHHTLVVSR